MHKRVYWSIADTNHLPYFKIMEKSFRKFHPNDELILFGDKEIKDMNDKYVFYRATPVFTKKLMRQGYTEVCKIDADSIITGNLDSIWDGDYDVAVVNNSNPKEMESYPVTVWDISPLAYVNCGFVVMKNPRFVEHWNKLCFQQHFLNYQFREQDLLNIMVHYGDYEVKKLDEEDSFYGLASKQYWLNIEVRGDDLVLPKGSEWPDRDKYIKVIHYAGGEAADKMNYRIHFREPVIKWLDKLLK